MNIVVCDDEQEITSYLKKTLEGLIKSEDKLWCYLNEDKLTSDIKEKIKTVDILFMDIQLNHSNGIDFVSKNAKYLKDTQLIYITGYDEYIEDTFKTDPIYVLRKPLSEDKIASSYKKALDKINNGNAYIIFKTLKETIKIKINNLLYMESKGRLIDIHTSKEVKTIYAKLSDIELENKDKFVRIHKSFLVNISKIKIYKYNKITLENNIELPISRSHQKECKEKIMSFMVNDDE